MSEVTQILCALQHGDAQVAEKLLPLVYEELRNLAAAKLAQERPGQTLQATALVHEAYLRLVGSSNDEPESDRPRWQSQGHFFAAAAEAMRRILIDAARKKKGSRNGGSQQRADLTDWNCLSLPVNDALLDLDAALTQLEAIDLAAAQTVKLRVFAGMSVEETADALNVSPRTAKRNWAYARAWLSRELAAYNQHED